MVLIDQPRVWHRGRRWSHLVSDTGFDELHEFARAAGLPPRGFHRDHYDIPEEMFADMVARGAQVTPSREIVAALRAAGLRRVRTEPVQRIEPVQASESIQLDAFA